MTGLPRTGICDHRRHEWQEHLRKRKTFHVYAHIYKLKHKVHIIHNACEPVILEVCKYYCGSLNVYHRDSSFWINLCFKFI